MRILFSLLTFFSLPIFAQTYITNVNIIDVEKQKVVPNQTVVFTGNVISQIRHFQKIKIPDNASVIDGNGKYLLPGMTDAHIHFFQNGGLYTRPDVIDLRKIVAYESEMQTAQANIEDYFKRYLHAGITTVIDPGANKNFLHLRDNYRTNSFAPAVYMSGPLLTSYEPEVYKNLGDNEPFSLVPDAETGIKMMQDQLPYKPDFIKIWYIADPKNVKESAEKYQPVVNAIIAEAHKHGLKVAVHAPERITAQLAVESGCDYLVHQIEDEEVTDAFVQLLKSNNVALCPTLIVSDRYLKTFAQSHDFSLYEFRYSNAAQLGSLYDLKHLKDTALINMYKTYFAGHSSEYAKQNAIRSANLKKMADAGVIIAAGTDAGNIGTMHASSYFSELEAMKESGLSNWQILQSATINGAKVLGKEHEFGSIAQGKIADLVLLSANPVDDIENLKQIEWVVNKGNVIRPGSLLAETPLTLVQHQLNAYNARDIEAFLEPYADDIEIYQYPDSLAGKGKEIMRKIYSQMFAALTELHCEVTERMVLGNIVIDKERVTGMGNQAVEAIAIYHILKGKIQKVYFIQ